ncbi:unnamed protein product [Gongylonema pulchrum]|uniref:Uncharacterized protein n=1 Tax=Gongylonema pulchrum TaxID=637853 RepID=A0A183EYZ2_9BILA|nr:unnamed protein product [Gongylonema pulchrum]
MELLRSYATSSDGASSDEELMRQPVSLESCKSLALSARALDVAPMVATRDEVGGVRRVDPRIRELDYNPRYEELFQPQVVSFAFCFPR